MTVIIVMLQICDGVGTLIHSATMSDVSLDILDWNFQQQEQQEADNNCVDVSPVESGHPVEAEETDSGPARASRSMFTIITTPRGGSIQVTCHSSMSFSRRQKE